MVALSLLLIGLIAAVIAETDDDDAHAYFSFDLEASAGGEMVHFSSLVQCERHTLSIGKAGKLVAHYVVRAKSLGRRLSNGQGFFVAIPNVCSYLRTQEGAPINGRRLGHEWPSILAPRAIIPLAYLTDEP